MIGARLTRLTSRLSDDSAGAISLIRQTRKKGAGVHLTIVTGRELARRLVGEVCPGLKRSGTTQ